MRRHFSNLPLLVLLASLAACSDSNPAGPSAVGGHGGAVITGAIAGASSSGGATTASARPDAGPPTGIVVTIAGTTISAPVDAKGSFTLTNVPGGTLTLVFTGPGINSSVTLANVVAGQTIELTLNLDGAAIVLEAERRSTGNEEQLEGRVEALPPTTAAGALVVAGRTVMTTPTTQFLMGNDTITFASLALGQRVHVRGTTSGDALTATLIQLQNTNTDIPVIVNGLVTALGTPFGPTAFTFFVGDREVRGDSATEFFGGSAFADLVAGARVEVKGAPGNGFVRAVRLHVSGTDDDDDADDGDDDDEKVLVSAAGAITAAAGKCPVKDITVGALTFKVNGSTTLVGTTCAALTTGVSVSVDGHLTSPGHAIASRVQVQ